jgi:hypothetical protein
MANENQKGKKELERIKALEDKVNELVAALNELGAVPIVQPLGSENPPPPPPPPPH